jgi:O-antigen/teichoic acid export membrane protein
MLKSVSSNWLVTIVTIVSAYILTPFTLHRLGDGGYGTWNLITSITGYLALLVLGVPMASVRFFAEHVADGDDKRLNDAIASCMGLYLILGAIALAGGAALFAFFALSFDIPVSIGADARLAFGVTVLWVSLGFAGSLPSGVLAAADDFVARNAVRLAGVALRFVLTIVILTVWPTLTMLAVIQVACLVFDFQLSWWVARRRHPELRLRLGNFDWQVVRRIFAFSLYVLVLNAGARLSFETDSIVIGKFDRIESIPYFTIANSFVIYLMEFVIAIGAVVMPMATRLKTQQRSPELRQVFLKWSKIAVSLTMLAGLFLIILGPRFIAWWIGPSYEVPSGQVLRILMVSYLVFLPVRGVALPILMGLGKPGLPTIAFLAAGLVNVVLSIALAGPYGIAGVAVGTAIPNVLFAAVVLVQTCRVLEIPVAEYVRYVGPRALIGSLPPLALLLWFRLGLDVRSLGALAAAGVAMSALFAVMSVFFVYRNDPYVDLRGRLLALRGGGRA